MTQSFLLDTNVVAELIRNSPQSDVLPWVLTTDFQSMFLSVISEAELRYGAVILPPGRRRSMLIADIDRLLNEKFGERILPFDRAAACEYAELALTRRTLGRPIQRADCMIAAIAKCRGLSIATRNTRDFEDLGLDVVNPWSYSH